MLMFERIRKLYIRSLTASGIPPVRETLKIKENLIK